VFAEVFTLTFVRLMDSKKISRALVSVYDKTGLEPLIRRMHHLGITLISTGGTKRAIEQWGIPVNEVAELTGFPEILGGRVKTLHPLIFGGILQRSMQTANADELQKHHILPIDLVVVDLYPFEKMLNKKKSGKNIGEDELMEMIDIGGIALIRAAAKNFKEVLVIPSAEYYPVLEQVLHNGGTSDSLLRQRMAACSFVLTARYDSIIYKYLESSPAAFAEVHLQKHSLRYGENPHQKGSFFGSLNDVFDQLNGKELSYNNLLDIDAALGLIGEFDSCTCAILKHTNACGVASAETTLTAWQKAFQADQLSAFGGIVVFNRPLDEEIARALHPHFLEIIIAPDFSSQALALLKQKKNRIILQSKNLSFTSVRFQSALNGILFQERDFKSETCEDLKTVTQRSPDESQIRDLLFALRIVKHTRSNAIVLARDQQMLGSGMGQTSRVDALQQAIEKALRAGLNLTHAVMASDAFFPFPDCVEIAARAGITAIAQPGGSVKDQDSILMADRYQIAMVFTGYRHFRH
jgi:phosphoribosylaminoimidazolecarboxamide formyltransferase/IMP cyclohydrolase